MHEHDAPSGPAEQQTIRDFFRGGHLEPDSRRRRLALLAGSSLLRGSALGECVESGRLSEATAVSGDVTRVTSEGTGSASSRTSSGWTSPTRSAGWSRAESLRPATRPRRHFGRGGRCFPRHRAAQGGRRDPERGREGPPRAGPETLQEASQRAGRDTMLEVVTGDGKLREVSAGDSTTHGFRNSPHHPRGGGRETARTPFR